MDRPKLVDLHEFIDPNELIKVSEMIQLHVITR